MKKDKLESYLGEYVEVTLVDGSSYIGILSKTDDYLDIYKKPGYYCVRLSFDDDQTFKSSHIKNIKIYNDKD